MDFQRYNIREKQKEKGRKKEKKKKRKEKEKKNDRKNSKDISGPFSDVVGSVGSLPRQFPLFNFFCFLVSSVSDFHPDTGGAVVDTFFFLFFF